jgi:hypothetical protein
MKNGWVGCQPSDSIVMNPSGKSSTLYKLTGERIKPNLLIVI